MGAVGACRRQTARHGPWLQKALARQLLHVPVPDLQDSTPSEDVQGDRQHLESEEQHDEIVGHRHHDADGRERQHGGSSRNDQQWPPETQWFKRPTTKPH